MDFWVPFEWNLEGYVSSNVKHCPLDFHCHLHYSDFQGLVFVVGLVQAVGLVAVVGCEEFIAALGGITEHLTYLWLHLGLGLTLGHSRLFAEIVPWTCCQTGLEHDL